MRYDIYLRDYEKQTTVTNTRKDRDINIRFLEMGHDIMNCLFIDGFMDDLSKANRIILSKNNKRIVGFPDIGAIKDLVTNIEEGCFEFELSDKQLSQKSLDTLRKKYDVKEIIKQAA